MLTRNNMRALARSSRTVVIHHPDCEGHKIKNHPERPARVSTILQELRGTFGEALEEILAPKATREQLSHVHTNEHLDYLFGLCDTAEHAHRIGDISSLVLQIDEDTKIMHKSRAAILRAAGACIAAVDEVMCGRFVNAFCCVRPPGHHASSTQSMGFCYVNNVAVGMHHARSHYGIERVAVFDMDVHHGNGTQPLLDDENGFYASVHQGFDFYPCTGFDEETGTNNNVVNVMCKEGSGSEEFRKACETKIFPALKEFEPELIILSAGFDGHEMDHLAQMRLSDADYGWVTQRVCEIAEEICEGRLISVLEGGYNLNALRLCSVAHVKALLEAARLHDEIALYAALVDEKPEPSPYVAPVGSVSQPPISNQVKGELVIDVVTIPAVSGSSSGAENGRFSSMTATGGHLPLKKRALLSGGSSVPMHQNFMNKPARPHYYQLPAGGEGGSMS